MASRLAVWWDAARPKTLPAAVVPVAVGTACAHAVGEVRWGPALGALAGALLIQIGTNFANDVFDHEKGADAADRLGPTRAVASGQVTPRDMRRAMALTFGLAFVVGLYLAAASGWPILAVGAVSILAGIGYTGGPYPLGYHGLGDVAVMLFFGFVGVLGTVWVQTLTLPAVAWWAAVPVGALATAILVVNNVRDRRSDARAGKHTLAVRWGKTGGVVEYALALLAAAAVPAALALANGSPWPALPLLTLPWGLVLLGRLARLEGRALNPVLAGTALLLLAHGALFAAGLVLVS